MRSTIVSGKITKDTTHKIEKAFSRNITSICEGKTWVYVTKTGGVHYTGTKTETKAISFELSINKSYLVVLLYEYPKGVIVHFFIPYGKPNMIPEAKLEEITGVLMKILLEDKE